MSTHPDPLPPEVKKQDKKPRKPRLDPNVVQRMASDPKSSAWVTASAGTGKTKVLTDRVLRLMLDGADPKEILCLTFTRAGASVMTNRVREELSRWASMPEAQLATRLRKLSGKTPDAGTVTRARGLFSVFLDAPQAMRIQTIHSFSQDLIRRFPIESGIPPYFDVMDDQTADDILRESQVAILKRIQKEPDTALARAVRTITPEVAEDDFAALIGELTYRRGQLLSIIHAHGGLDGTIDAVYTYLGAPKGITAKMMNDMLNADTGLHGRAPDITALNRAADMLAGGTAADLEKAKIIKAWLLHPEQRVDLFWDYTSVFLKADGGMRKKIAGQKDFAGEDILMAEAARLMQGIEDIATVNVARGTESLLRLSTAILDEYKERKQRLNLLDYDDLVWHANLMLREDNAAAWVIEKLPGDLRHILVDEAQDTNPDQWALVSSIAHEFFSDPKNVAGKTIFVVGDEKQSIFSFQRADPREFSRQRQIFSDLVTKAGGTWRDVEMEIAFRSSPAITTVVDAVFLNPDAADGLFSDDGTADNKKVRHNPFRKGQGGVVELHPVIRGGDKSDVEPWSLPLKKEEVDDPSVEMAEMIADKIKGWIDKGEILESRKRPVSPADIMILVRRRSAFVDHMVRALKKRDVPVAGADRMSLRGQIVVMDMLALAETLLFPSDDYKLACVLKSPFIGLTDADLEKIAATRTATLRAALADKAAEVGAPAIYVEANRYLERLAATFNAERPYEFFSRVLMDDCARAGKSGLNALYGRLGFEAEDPLVEFLNAVERFEKNHIPSLQGFIAWLEAGEAEVKREVSLSSESPKVHIMTVHGAKGLEAPIVILPDTTGIPSDNTRARPRFLWPEGDRTIPLWVPKADLENNIFKRERERVEMERDREFRRLLYVAMTRAADRLYVFGAENTRETPDNSWYSLIRTGLAVTLKDEIERLPLDEKKIDEDKNDADEDMPEILRFKAPQLEKPEPDGLSAQFRARVVGVPAWARRAPGQPAARTRKFTPSEYNAEDKVMNDNYAAPSPLQSVKEKYFANLGTAIHQLFEFLPVLPPAERETAARRHLEKPVWGFSKEDQATTVVQVMKILNDPDFGMLFDENARAEVSIAGLVEKDGEKMRLSGQIDRLVVNEKEKTVTVIDFKNSRSVPKKLSDVSYKHIVQMASYRLVLQQMYPGYDVRCALLWTRAAKLMPLTAEKMDAALTKQKLNVLTISPDRPKP